MDWITVCDKLRYTTTTTFHMSSPLPVLCGSAITSHRSTAYPITSWQATDPPPSNTHHHHHHHHHQFRLQWLCDLTIMAGIILLNCSCHPMESNSMPTTICPLISPKITGSSGHQCVTHCQGSTDWLPLPVRAVSKHEWSKTIFIIIGQLWRSHSELAQAEKSAYHFWGFCT